VPESPLTRPQVRLPNRRLIWSAVGAEVGVAVVGVGLMLLGAVTAGSVVTALGVGLIPLTFFAGVLFSSVHSIDPSRALPDTGLRNSYFGFVYSLWRETDPQRTRKRRDGTG
jgi:hypothetical protein